MGPRTTVLQCGFMRWDGSHVITPDQLAATPSVNRSGSKTKSVQVIPK